VIGLVGALQSLCADLTHAGVAVAFTYDNVPEVVPPDVMLCLYRVAQEALQNALKHSRATELALDLSGTSDGLTLTFRDDGVGFDIDAAWKTGIGLRSMSERLQAVGGSLTLTSRPGAGTRLRAFVPRHALQSDSQKAT
jgi:signal transduction histidine kinase